MEQHRSGYVALIGRPNAGKSTLLNQILETKLVAVTPRPQTTRHRIFGIYDREEAQVIFQDTPGLLEPKDDMHHFMVREAGRALEDADVAVWLIDGIKGVTKRENIIANKTIAELQIPLMVVFNKVDKVPLPDREGLVKSLEPIQLPPDYTTFYISALHGDGVGDLLEQIVAQLPEGPKFYPPDQLSDRATRFFIEEIIREKAFIQLQDELPYSLAVELNKVKEEPSITRIEATLHVERDSQKAIVVGKKGSMIKAIGMEARKEIESLMGTKVYLELWAKVSKHWRKKEERLKDFGYTNQD